MRLARLTGFHDGTVVAASDTSDAMEIKHVNGTGSNIDAAIIC